MWGGCSGTIQRLGKVLQGSEDAGWEGFWTGLGSGAVCGSASLASARTLARTVELWGDRPDVWVCLFVRGSGTTAQEWEGSGPGSASLACPRTLARCVELWGIRADVWVWLFWNDPGKRKKSSFLSHFGPGALGRSGELCGV